MGLVELDVSHADPALVGLAPFAADFGDGDLSAVLVGTDLLAVRLCFLTDGQDGVDFDSSSAGLEGGVLFGAPCWTRTNDLRINSPSLYRLS